MLAFLEKHLGRIHPPKLDRTLKSKNKSKNKLKNKLKNKSKSRIIGKNIKTSKPTGSGEVVVTNVSYKGGTSAQDPPPDQNKKANIVKCGWD